MDFFWLCGIQVCQRSAKKSKSEKSFGVYGNLFRGSRLSGKLEIGYYRVDQWEGMRYMDLPGRFWSQKRAAESPEIGPMAPPSMGFR